METHDILITCQVLRPSISVREGIRDDDADEVEANGTSVGIPRRMPLYKILNLKK